VVFLEQTYSVLVVSASENINRSLDGLLSRNLYYPVDFTGSIAGAKRLINERHYDLVIINSPLPDDSGILFAEQVSNSNNMVCLMLIKADLYETINAEVSASGVYSISKPTSSNMISQALSWMTATRERLRKFESRSQTMEEKMEEIRLVNRAKWLLIENLSMTEGDAHKYIEKQAMNRCIPKREVAEGIIKTYH